MGAGGLCRSVPVDAGRCGSATVGWLQAAGCAQTAAAVQVGLTRVRWAPARAQRGDDAVDSRGTVLYLPHPSTDGSATLGKEVPKSSVHSETQQCFLRKVFVLLFTCHGRSDFRLHTSRVAARSACVDGTSTALSSPSPRNRRRPTCQTPPLYLSTAAALPVNPHRPIGQPPPPVAPALCHSLP